MLECYSGARQEVVTGFLDMPGYIQKRCEALRSHLKAKEGERVRG